MSWITSTVTGVAAIGVAWSGAWTGSAPVRAATGTGACSAVTVALHPGLNPPWTRPRSRLAPARDIPRRGFSVSLPVYPNATPLTPFIASPFPSYPADPYLQTGSVEYRVAATSNAVLGWASRVFRGCGWRPDGRWSTNASAFTSGLTFAANNNPDLTVAVSVGAAGANGAYLGYGVMEVTLPRRPPSSYLRGPFSAVRITLRMPQVRTDQASSRYARATIVDRTAIVRLVRAINAIRGHRTAPVMCVGGVGGAGPAWLSFVKANGTIVHAFEIGPGACGGLAVNGTRWLTDGGAVWNAIVALTQGSGK